MLGDVVELGPQTRDHALIRSRTLNCHPQLDRIIGGINQILLRSQIPFGGLDRRVAEQQLNLLKLPAGGSAHFRAASPQIMGSDSGNTSRRRVWPK